MVARYELKGIEYMIPKLWSSTKEAYDKNAALGIHHWGPKRQLFYRSRNAATSRHEVYSRMKILSVIRMPVDKQFGYGYLKEIVLRRVDQKEYTFKEANFSRLHLNDIEDMFLLYVQHKLHNLIGNKIVDLVNALRTFTRGVVIQRRVEDIQLGVEIYQKKLNITRPQTTCDGISFKQPYTIVYDPRGVVYLKKTSWKRLMRANELYKFCDRTLKSVRDNLNEMLHNFVLGYNHGMQKRAWTEKDHKWIDEMLKMIDNLLLETELALEQSQQGASNDVLLITGTEDSHHGPSDAMHNPPKLLKLLSKEVCFISHGDLTRYPLTSLLRVGKRGFQPKKLAQVNKARAMSSASSAVTYTFVHTDSEPGRVFWGADEKISDGGSPRVIVYGYDGLPMQPVAPPSPDYIPDSEEPQTPPVPQDEDEREPMFIQPHDPDYVPEPIYPEYIPLEDEHVFPVEEQPLPPVDSPTAELPGFVAESDPEEYEDNETEDGPVDYPMDGGDNRDDDEDEDEEDEDEEEEHLAPADSAVVVPTVEHVSPPEGTEPVIPPPSTDITTTGARITIRLQAFISLPPEAEVERLLAMTTPSPSPHISLSPPSAGERLARCTALSAHSSPPHVPSPLLPSSGCPTQTQTLRIASTQALIDAVTVKLPSPPLPPLPPSLYIPPPIDRGDDLPEYELPPRKRLCLSTLGSRYEVGESSTARPTVDPAEAVLEITPMTLGEVNTRVTELAELHEDDTQDLYALLKDAQEGRTHISQRIMEEEAYASREAWAYAIGLSQAVHSELQTHREHVYAHESQLHAHQTHLQLHCTLLQTQHQVHETRFQMQQAEIAELQETDCRHQAQMAEIFRVMRDMRREMVNKQAELLALREQRRRARQPRSNARAPDHQEAFRDADSHI
ncbi:hypothetical protein Tco_0878179 [Tanacetum coccineum]|uniref:Uncharacterized protein n=1 Tax=Tanacetum coccineum TaxID=301880 RepID=A0ABQ5C0L8_9ASTR